MDSEGRWIYEDRNGELVNYKDLLMLPKISMLLVTVFLNGMRDGTILFVIKLRLECDDAWRVWFPDNQWWTYEL